jgi:hypothetical protein
MDWLGRAGAWCKRPVRGDPRGMGYFRLAILLEAFELVKQMWSKMQLVESHPRCVWQFASILGRITQKMANIHSRVGGNFTKSGSKFGNESTSNLGIYFENDILWTNLIKYNDLSTSNSIMLHILHQLVEILQLPLSHMAEDIVLEAIVHTLLLTRRESSHQPDISQYMGIYSLHSRTK